MSIRYYADNSPIPKQIKRRLTKEWINDIIHIHKKVTGNIAFIFCNENKMLEINRQYLNHNYLTDIITFDYTDDNCLSGDLYICTDTVKSNSIQFNTNYTEELYRVMIHGILHLCGLGDCSEDEKLKMNAEENIALEILQKRFKLRNEF